MKPVFNDHHHLIFSIMRTTFASEELKKFVYRDYKTFSQKSFKNYLMSKTVDENVDCLKFEKEFIDKINMHLRKLSYLVVIKNLMSVNKVLRSAIMKRTRLKK